MLGKTAARSVFPTPRQEASSAVLIHCRGYPTPARITSLVGIVRTIWIECGENSAVRSRHAIEVPTPDRTTHDEVVSAPGMTCPETAIRYNGPGKIGESEGRYLRSHSKVYSRIVKRLHGTADLRQKARWVPAIGLIRTRGAVTKILHLRRDLS